MAHFFIYRLIESSGKNESTPDWIMVGLLSAQGVALLYVVFLFFKDRRSIYELVSSTRVTEGKNPSDQERVFKPTSLRRGAF